MKQIGNDVMSINWYIMWNVLQYFDIIFNIEVRFGEVQWLYGNKRKDPLI